MLLLTNIFLIITVANANGQRCEEGWDDKVEEGLNCLLFDTTTDTYDNIKQFCASKRAHLIELKSEEELEVLNKILNVKDQPPRSLWWGGATLVGGGQWKWTVSGEPLGQWIWGKWGSQAGEYYPTWTIAKQCFNFGKTNWNNGKWKGQDFPCRMQISAAICQKKPEKLTTSTTTITPIPTTTSTTITPIPTTTSTTSATTSGIRSISDLI